MLVWLSYLEKLVGRPERGGKQELSMVPKVSFWSWFDVFRTSLKNGFFAVKSFKAIHFVIYSLPVFTEASSCCSVLLARWSKTMWRRWTHEGVSSSRQDSPLEIVCKRTEVLLFLLYVKIFVGKYTSIIGLVWKDKSQPWYVSRFKPDRAAA